MFLDHVAIIQALYEEDSDMVWLLQNLLYGMPSAARAWHKTMSVFLQREGCITGFEKSMWT